MPLLRKFLVVDDNADGRTLLARTLLRVFPQAIVQECQDPATAVASASTEEFDAVIVHRAGDVDGAPLVQLLRRVNPEVPIVMISGHDDARKAIASGATRFLRYDEWLRIGTVVTELVAKDMDPAGRNHPTEFRG